MKAILLLYALSAVTAQMPSPFLDCQQPHVIDLHELVGVHYKLIDDNLQITPSLEVDGLDARLKILLTLMYVQLEPSTWKDLKETIVKDPKDLASKKAKNELTDMYKKLYRAITLNDDDFTEIVRPIYGMGLTTLKKIKQLLQVPVNTGNTPFEGKSKKEAIFAIACELSATNLMEGLRK